MTADEVIIKAGKLNELEVRAFSAKLIADAVDRLALATDRQTKIQEAALKMQMEMSGMSKELIEKMMGMFDKNRGDDISGDEWKDGPGDLD